MTAKSNLIYVKKSLCKEVLLFKNPKGFLLKPLSVLPIRVLQFSSYIMEYGTASYVYC